MEASRLMGWGAYLETSNKMGACGAEGFDERLNLLFELLTHGRCTLLAAA